MLTLFIISSTALSKYDSSFEDNVINHIKSQANQEITNNKKLQQEQEKIDLKQLLKNYTTLKKMTHFPSAANYSEKNSTHHCRHHHHTHNFHHYNQNNASYDYGDKKLINNKDIKMNHHRNHNQINKKSPKRYHHYNHRINKNNKPHYKDVPSQINDEMHNEKSIEKEENQLIGNKEKQILNKLMRNEDFVNKIKQIIRTNHDKTDKNSKNLENNELNNKFLKDKNQNPSQKSRGINHNYHGLGHKKRYHKYNKQPIHQWEEYQKLKIQHKMRKFEETLQNSGSDKNEEQRLIKYNIKNDHDHHNFRNSNDKMHQKKYSELSSGAIKSIKSEYMIGIIISVGIILSVIVVILIFKLNKKNNDESNDYCQRENEDIKNYSSNEVDA